MVESSGYLYLFILTHGGERRVPLIAEVHDSALHKAHLSRGKLTLGLRVKEVGIYLQQLMCVSAVVAAQVEVGVIGKVKGGILVALGIKIHGQHPIIRELIPHGYLYIPGEALISIRGHQAECNALFIRCKLPNPLIEAVPAPMEGKQLMAPVQLIFHAAKLCL